MLCSQPAYTARGVTSAPHNRAPPLLPMRRGRAVLLFCAIATVVADVNTRETTVTVRVEAAVEAAASQGGRVGDPENTTLDVTKASEGSRPVVGAGVKNGVAPTSKFAGSPEHDAQALVHSAGGTENCIPSSGATVACGGIARGVRVDAVKSGAALAATGDPSDTSEMSDPRRLLARRMMPRHGRALTTSGTCSGCKTTPWVVKNVYSTKAAYYQAERRCATVCVYSFCCCGYSWGQEEKCTTVNKYYPAVTTKTGEVCECSACPAGRYGADGFSCADCGVGYYCTGGSARAQCKAGTHQASTTASASTSCKACRAGYSCGGFTESICKVRGERDGGWWRLPVAVCVGHMCREGGLTYFAPPCCCPPPHAP